MQYIAPGDISWATTYAAIINNNIPQKGNIIYDVAHPYYFEGADGGPNEPANGQTPEQKADWYFNAMIRPAIAAFGAQNIWVGETFAFSSGTYALQIAFTTRMINYLVDNGVGFQIWCFYSSTNRQWQIDALTASHYYTLYW